MLDVFKRFEYEVPEKGLVVFSDKNNTFSLLEHGTHQIYRDSYLSDNCSKEMFILSILAAGYISKAKFSSGKDFDKFVESAHRTAMEILQKPKLREENEYDYIMSDDLVIFPDSLEYQEEREKSFKGKETFTLSKEHPVQDFVEKILNGDFDSLPVRSILILNFLIASVILPTLYLSEKAVNPKDLKVAVDLVDKLNKKNELFEEIIKKNSN